MDEKVGQAMKGIQIARSLLFEYHLKSIIKGSLQCITLFRRGKAFLICHNKSFRKKNFLKQQYRQQKKLKRTASKQYFLQTLKQELLKQRLLLRCALLLRKRYF